MLRLIGMAAGAAFIIAAASLLMNREKVMDCVKDEGLPKMPHGKKPDDKKD